MSHLFVRCCLYWLGLDSHQALNQSNKTKLLVLNVFSATPLSWKCIMITRLHRAVEKSITFVLFQVKSFWLWGCTSYLWPVNFLDEFTHLKHKNKTINCCSTHVLFLSETRLNSSNVDAETCLDMPVTLGIVENNSHRDETHFAHDCLALPFDIRTRHSYSMD